ncbi:MAG: M1 family peptidase [Desulfobacterales bacterium]|nr:MAG: M1 family peptidase [Desulfobacterales bacterium]
MQTPWRAIDLEKTLDKSPGRSFVLLLGVLLTLLLLLGRSVAPAAGLTVHHNLQVEIFPAQGKLSGTDDMAIDPSGKESLQFFLAEHAYDVTVQVNTESRDFSFENGRLRFDLYPAERGEALRVMLRYAGIFDDPVPLRPVNTDNPGYGVSGTISPGGSFLLAGSGWYPELEGGRATYTLQVSAPAGMLAVTAGKSLGHVTRNGKTVSTWSVGYPVEGLSLSAAPYHVQDKPTGAIKALTYFLPEDNHLAPAYLEATAGYLAFYADLFGPYPFEKFAVVENFFPTGFGFPSYTLLGSTVLRLPFIIHTSLGHEIAHCWWGNGVYADFRRGNWSEGLTTYVADYLYQERQSEDDARAYRLQMLRNFSTLVDPANDLALVHFVSRTDPLTQTIGYDKGAMVFHMLRRRLGDGAFWAALRDVYRNRRFQRTSWDDFQTAFERRGQRSLQDFFDQWIRQKGAPQLSLQAVHAAPVAGTWQVTGRIAQKRPYFDLDLDLTLATGQRDITRRIGVSGEYTAFRLDAQEPPQRLTLDPDYHVLRRLDPSEIPASINSLKSATSVLVVLSAGLEAEVKATADILSRSLGLKHYELVDESEMLAKQLVENDLLIIGFPRSKSLLAKLPAQVSLQRGAFVLDENAYDRPADAFFGVFAHPLAEGRVEALFWPLSPLFAEVVARKVTHYGKYSYLVFRNGQNHAKGFWPIENSPVVYRWDDPGGAGGPGGR